MSSRHCRCYARFVVVYGVLAMDYHVAVRADGWETVLADRYRMHRQHLVVQLDLGLRLIVELERTPDSLVRVTAARLESAYLDRWGQTIYRTIMRVDPAVVHLRDA